MIRSIAILKYASAEERMFFLLRFGILGCFVGHGAWGLIGKESWLTFFNVFYFPESISRIAMPIVGLMDITVGVVLFFAPSRRWLWWAAIWTIFTALLRPSAGMGMSEFFERAGNYGVPLAMLYLTASIQPRLQFAGAIHFQDIQWEKYHLGFERILRWSLFLLLAGHGGLAFFNEHPVITKHLDFIGWGASRSNIMIFGAFEVLLALVVLLRPRIAGLMVFVLFYKLVTESLHPIAGHSRDVFETIERMGDYVIPLILIAYYAHFPKR